MLLPQNTRYQIPDTRYSKIPGFTLIELLIVISIIAVLVTLATYSYGNAQMRARDSKRKQDLEAVAIALNLYYQDNGSYPGGVCLSSPWWGCWQETSPGFFLGSGSNYISQMPQDPTFKDTGGACASGDKSNAYVYLSLNAGQDYILATRLENPRDRAINYDGSLGSCTNFANYSFANPK